MSELISCVGLCGRSHLESGYVASQAAGSMFSTRLPPSCKRAGAVRGHEGTGRCVAILGSGREPMRLHLAFGHVAEKADSN